MWQMPANRCGSKKKPVTVSVAGFFVLFRFAGTDPAAFRSAVRNLLASLLVFAAALIRLYDLSATEREGQTGAASGARKSS